LIVEQEDLAYLGEHLRHIPNFGEYRPDGWKLWDTYFVDSSGFGGEDEPAMTYSQFINVVKANTKAVGPGLGYAFIEVGQFQVVIGEFVKEG
jgi:hypothetical protein